MQIETKRSEQQGGETILTFPHAKHCLFVRTSRRLMGCLPLLKSRDIDSRQIIELLSNPPDPFKGAVYRLRSRSE